MTVRDGDPGACSRKCRQGILFRTRRGPSFQHPTPAATGSAMNCLASWLLSVLQALIMIACFPPRLLPSLALVIRLREREHRVRSDRWELPAPTAALFDQRFSPRSDAKEGKFLSQGYSRRVLYAGLLAEQMVSGKARAAVCPT